MCLQETRTGPDQNLQLKLFCRVRDSRMQFDDFKKNYDKVEICNLTPDALTDDALHQWDVNVFEGNWIRGSTAGGCRNYIGEVFESRRVSVGVNPQTLT